MTRKLPKPKTLAEIRRGVKLAKVYIKGDQLKSLENDPSVSKRQYSELNAELYKDAQRIMSGPDGDSDSIFPFEFWKDSEPPHYYNETGPFRKAFKATLAKYTDKIE